MQAVDVFMRLFKLNSRAAAVEAGQELLRLNVFRHVNGQYDFQDAYLLYRLQLHRQPLVLNTWRSFASTEESAPQTTSRADGSRENGDSTNNSNVPVETGPKPVHNAARAHRILNAW